MHHRTTDQTRDREETPNMRKMSSDQKWEEKEMAADTVEKLRHRGRKCEERVLSTPTVPGGSRQFPFCCRSLS